MGKTGKIFIALVVVVVVAGIAIALSQSDADTKTSEQTAPTNSSASDASTPIDTPEQSPSSEAPAEESVAAIVTYDGSKFSVSTNTVKAGDSVKIVNSSDKQLDFDSDPHPAHTDNSELNVGKLAPGESQTFILNKKGTWGFHNHLNARQSGEITVL